VRGFALKIKSAEKIYERLLGIKKYRVSYYYHDFSSESLELKHEIVKARNREEAYKIWLKHIPIVDALNSIMWNNVEINEIK
jgi:hypothetical protein